MTVRKLITLPDTLIEELEALSKATGEKQSELIANALDMYFDYLDAKAAEKQLKAIHEGSEKVYSFEAAMRELSLEA
ncbi:MAG: ribbon-helix-helix domain-containing protein [Campylobacterales bacterium]|nr:ribbon-helix-helix domain-containing protein [Campylobacterales bacterium]